MSEMNNELFTDYALSVIVFCVLFQSCVRDGLTRAPMSIFMEEWDWGDTW